MLEWVDWLIIIAFLLLSLAIGLYYRKQAGKNISEFFLGGRNIPWYVAGVSMVATTFAADTPLAVTELVAKGGIAMNWLWWSFLFGGALTTFFFAHLWQRAQVLTELEFIELRYSGKLAAFLRGFRSVYLGIFMNCMIIGWVNLAMISLLQVFFDLGYQEAFWATAGLMLLASFYSALSGLRGVAVTDFVQFIIAMTGCIVLAFLVLHSDTIGGMDGLKSVLPADTFRFLPVVGGEVSTGSAMQTFTISIGAFLSFVAIQWWASWYPGAEPGGGGYIAQRMMSTKDEKSAVAATLLFQIGHYCLRPWPWIITALCAVALYQPAIVNPELHQVLETTEAGSLQEFQQVYGQALSPAEVSQVRFYYEPRLGFVFTMRDFLPTGLKGLLLVAFIAAYLSTISTQVNWGASYVLNDLYKRFIRREGPNEEADNRHYVGASKVISLIVMAVSLCVTPFLNSIAGVWEFILQCGAGLGLVLILRWYWYRVNAWSEISATVAPLVGFLLGKYVLEPALGPAFADNNGVFIFNVLFTTACWLAVTFLTRPTDNALLEKFYDRVRPGGWWPAAWKMQYTAHNRLPYLFVCWFLSVTMIYSILFATGKLLLQEYTAGFIILTLAIVSGFLLAYFMGKKGRGLRE